MNEYYVHLCDTIKKNKSHKRKFSIMKTLKPFQDRIVIQPTVQAEKTMGGIFLPETAKDESQEGTVVAVGPGKILENGTLIPVAVQVGQKVLYAKYGGSKIKVDGTDVLIVSEKDILAVVL